MKKKTIFFEEKFNVDINDFKSTTEINKFIEKRLKRKLKIKHINNLI